MIFRPGSIVRHGSNALDSSSPTERPSPVILSAAKDLAAERDRPFAEFPLSGANVLRVTVKVQPCHAERSEASRCPLEYPGYNPLSAPRAPSTIQVKNVQSIIGPRLTHPSIHLLEETIALSTCYIYYSYKAQFC